MSRTLECPQVRGLERVIASQAAAVGTFTVRRSLPAQERQAVGPWVFLDHFGPYRAGPDDGVGPHPHAGIETVTYLLAGHNRHRDSAGHEGVVGPGGAQWMTAGRGIVHAERALAEPGREEIVHGIQLWTSLPRALKATAPQYQRLEADAIERRTAQGVTLRVIAGELGALRGPARTLMPLILAHATLEAGAAFAEAVPPDFEMAAYVIEGRIRAGDSAADAGRLAVFAGDAPMVSLANDGEEAAEVLLLGGAPAEGPLVFHGPFVMNSAEQVRAAEIAYRLGRMGQLVEA